MSLCFQVITSPLKYIADFVTFSVVHIKRLHVRLWLSDSKNQILQLKLNSIMAQHSDTPVVIVTPIFAGIVPGPRMDLDRKTMHIIDSHTKTSDTTYRATASKQNKTALKKIRNVLFGHPLFFLRRFWPKTASNKIEPPQTK